MVGKRDQDVYVTGWAHLTLSLDSLSFLEAVSTVAPTIDTELISTNMSRAWILGSEGEGWGGATGKEGGREGRERREGEEGEEGGRGGRGGRERREEEEGEEGVKREGEGGRVGRGDEGVKREGYEGQMEG